MATNLRTYSESAIRHALKNQGERFINDRHTENANAAQLMYLLVELSNQADHISVRVEHPTITVYSNDEQLLFNIANKMPGGDPRGNNKVLEFWRPHEQTVSDLENNIVFVKTPPKYKYKIITREGQFNSEVRTPLFNYIVSLGEEVSISPGYAERLTFTMGTWLPSSKILVNDERMLLMFKLLAPSLISTIYELKVLPS